MQGLYEFLKVQENLKSTRMIQINLKWQIVAITTTQHVKNFISFHWAIMR
jgi:hypothetical protein